MPCSSEHMEPTPGELRETARVRELVENLADRLTHANDVLREYLLGNKTEKEILPFISYDAERRYVELRKQNDKLYVKVDAGEMAKTNELVDRYIQLNSLATRMEPPTKKQLAQIEKEQVAHRDEDIRRILRTAASADDRELMRKALSCDVNSPLAPQLGFDPDEV